MADWPKAPRLTSALKGRAAQVNVDTPAKARLEEALVRFRGAPLLRLESEEERLASTSDRPSLPVLAAAAVLLVAGLALSRIANVPEKVDTAGAAELGNAETDRSSDAADRTLPTIDGESTCSTNITKPEAHLLSVGEEFVEVGLSRPKPPYGRYPLVIGISSAASWSAQAEQIRFHEALEPVTVVYFSASVLERVEGPSLFDVLLGGLCSTPSYLVTTDLVETGEVICAGLASFGFWGYTLVNPGPPPSTCSATQPTLILSSDGRPSAIEAWADYYHCGAGQSRIDSAGNRITEYDACTSTLVHVQTASADPWDTPIDGIAPADFSRSIMEKAD